MRRLTVLVDFDQTLNNLNEAWVQYLNEKHGTTVSPDDIREWDMNKAFPMLRSKDIYEPLKTEELWEQVVPLPGAYDGVCNLKRDGHKVLIVTTSNPTTVPIKLEKVLFRYFPFFTYNDVVITSHKQLLLGDVLIDDAPHNLVGGLYKRILMTAPHNKSLNERTIKAARANSWDEAYELVKSIAEEKEWIYG